MAINTDNLTSNATKYAYDASLTTQTSAVANNSEMTMDDFWQLLATQMSSMNTMTKLSDAISSIASVTNNLSQVTLTTYSTGLLGREVTIAITNDKGELSDTIKGTVTGVDLTGATSVYVGGKKYELAQIMAVGDVPKKDIEDAVEAEKKKNETAGKTTGTTKA